VTAPAATRSAPAPPPRGGAPAPQTVAPAVREPAPASERPALPARPAAATSNGHGADDEAGRGPASPEQARWKGLVDALQRASASRFFRLSYSKVLEVGEDVLRVAVTGREAIAALTAADVRAQIEDAIERAFGRRLTFEPVAPGDGSVPSATANHAALDRQAREDPVVQLSVEILEGRVEGVLPRNRREH
jgi:hypothetical protein